MQTPAPITHEPVHTFPLQPPLGDPSMLPVQPPEVLQQEAIWEAEDADQIAMAKAFMDSKEYLRVIHWLRPCKSAKAAFLRVYSQYLVNVSSLGILSSLNEYRGAGSRKGSTTRMV